MITKYSLFCEKKISYNKWKNIISKEDFDRILNLDPSKTNKIDGKFSEWLLNMYKKGYIHNDNLNIIYKYLTLLHNKKISIDIYQYNTVDEFIEKMMVIDFQIQSNRYKDKNQNIEKVFQNDTWLVIIPNDKDASCKYGKGTKWCTASTKSDNAFDEYNNKGKLYIIINKILNRKFQLHIESDELCNEINDELFKNDTNNKDDEDIIKSDIELCKFLIQIGYKKINL